MSISEGAKMKEYLVAKYIRLYYNNLITKCVANAIQRSRLFLGSVIGLMLYLLVDAIQNNW